MIEEILIMIIELFHDARMPPALIWLNYHSNNSERKIEGPVNNKERRTMSIVVMTILLIRTMFDMRIQQ